MKKTAQEYYGKKEDGPASSPSQSDAPLPAAAPTAAPFEDIAPAPPAKTTKSKVKPPSSTEEKRPLLRRLFGIGIWGTVKLIALCILIGFFVMAANFDPRAPDADVPAAMAAVFKQTVAAAGWAALNFWKPALAGATIVLPIWVLWRLVSLPFRK